MKEPLIIILALILLIVVFKISSYKKFIVDGIRYKFNKWKKTAEVMSNNYSGDIVIPATVSYPGDERTFLVTRINYNAFHGCSDLTSITIPDSVTKFLPNAFKGCSSLSYIKVESRNTKFDSRNNCNAVIETGIDELRGGCKNTVIPEGVKSIGMGAFAYCTGLTSVIIPEGTVGINDSAFFNCSDLTTVTFPRSLKRIGKGAFLLCGSLADVYCYAEMPPHTIKESILVPFDVSHTKEHTTLHVPAASIKRYKATPLWKEFKAIVPIE